MISLKALGTMAVMTVVLPMAAATGSFAQNPPGNNAAHGSGARPGGGAPVYRFGAAPRTFSGGIRPNVGASVVAQSQPSGRSWRGNDGWRGNEGWRGDRRRDRNGFIPGVAAGVIIGGVLASPSYGGPTYYYGPGYADDQYYDDGPVAVAPAPAPDDAVTYCIQNYSSYDPASGTYLGNDGYPHACP